MLKAIFPFLFLFVLQIQSWAESGNDSSQYIIRVEKVLDNDERHYDTFRSLENSIYKMLSHYKITGASFALSKDGKLLYTRGFGFADKENQIEVLPQHQFRIASVSKLITAVAIFKLIEAGKLSLDQQVFGKGGILDQAIYNAHIYDPRIRQVTIRHLLTHSAGWDYSKKMDPMFNPRLMTRGNELLVDPNLTNLISYALMQGLHHEPGKESHYFNLGYCMLGEIIETISNTSYESFVQEAIFTPLGINSFHLGKNLKEEKFINEVLYYDFALRNSFTGSGELVPRPYGGTPVELLGPSGGWIASSMDIVKLINAIDGNDSFPDILSIESVTTMTQLSGVMPMGWISISKNKDWLRTGTLAGTHALTVRKDNGICYAILANSSTGLSSNFSEEMYTVIEKGLQTIRYWPSYNLFDSLQKEYMLLQKNAPCPELLHELYTQLPTPEPLHLLSVKE